MVVNDQVNCHTSGCFGKVVASIVGILMNDMLCRYFITKHHHLDV
jgi:hypothetical protein